MTSMPSSASSLLARLGAERRALEAAVAEQADHRDALHAVFLGELRLVVDVDLHTLYEPWRIAAIVSTTGETWRHGPHHGAQKSTITGRSLLQHLGVPLRGRHRRHELDRIVGEAPRRAVRPRARCASQSCASRRLRSRPGAPSGTRGTRSARRRARSSRARSRERCTGIIGSCVPCCTSTGTARARVGDRAGRRDRAHREHAGRAHERRGGRSRTARARARARRPARSRRRSPRDRSKPSSSHCSSTSASSSPSAASNCSGRARCRPIARTTCSRACPAPRAARAAAPPRTRRRGRGTAASRRDRRSSAPYPCTSSSSRCAAGLLITFVTSAMRAGYPATTPNRAGAASRSDAASFFTASTWWIWIRAGLER